jgi:hypothetical protein
LAKVVISLLIGVSDQADEKLFGEKLRSAPINVEVDAALILRILVLEIVGKARDG